MAQQLVPPAFYRSAGFRLKATEIKLLPRVCQPVKTSDTLPERLLPRFRFEALAFSRLVA